MCQNRRRRSSSTTDWPTRPVIVTNIRVATAWISTVTANTAAIRSSGPVSPDSSSGGMPLSIAMPTSQGPASAASDATTIAAAVHVTPRRYGRSRSVSSRRLRFRSSAASGAETSSTCSVAMPRHDASTVIPAPPTST